jgi:2-amino-4-hydroxy-6-hydroxymethyldihydropteridine diphosphokinase
MHVYLLLLGSNLGDRQNIIQSAMDDISEKIGDITQKSSLYETEPWGLADQPMFLNQAISVSSDKKPDQILEITTGIEKKYGNKSDTLYGPRYLDIDILYCDNLVMDTPQLKIPHPNLYHRNFVLVPLMEIAGDFEDPVLHISVDEIYDQCKDKQDVFLFE